MEHDAGILRSMTEELAGAPRIYAPSIFWQHFSARNVDQLERHGLVNFKRTVNQNYFNSLPTSFDDNKLRNVVRAWAAHPDTIPLRVRIEEQPFAEGFFEANPLLDPEKRDVYALFVALLWSVARRIDIDGVLDRLVEPDAGNPIRITLDGRLISQDLAHSVRERQAILSARRFASAERPVVAELGAGYGRLAYVLLQTLPCRYRIFDIPPALYIAQQYLPAVLPGRRIFRFRHFDRFDEIRDELADADLAFFTPNQLALVPPAALDVCVSISSLHEMRFEQIAHYLELMASRTRHAIYLKQWNVSSNTLDGITVTRAAYSLPAEWVTRFDRPDAVQDLFFEALFERT